jgi:hypothetical protein
MHGDVPVRTKPRNLFSAKVFADMKARNSLLLLSAIPTAILGLCPAHFLLFQGFFSDNMS